MSIDKLVSAIINDVVSGLKGYHQNLALNPKQIEEEVLALRLALIKKYFLEGKLTVKDFLMSIDCIDVDCEALDRCRCETVECGEKIAHFTIPQVIWDLGPEAINYIGSTDRTLPFNVITNLVEFNTRKYRKRGAKKPSVWVDPIPNVDGLLDCFIFNAPLIRKVTVIAAFKDPRQISKYNCCVVNADGKPVVINETLAKNRIDDIISFIDVEIKSAIVQEKLQYYRSNAAQPETNNQEFNTGN